MPNKKKKDEKENQVTYTKTKVGKTWFQSGNFWLPTGLCVFPKLSEPDGYGDNPERKYYSLAVLYEDEARIKETNQGKELLARVDHMKKELFPDAKKGSINMPWDLWTDNWDDEEKEYTRIQVKCNENRPPKVYGPEREKLDPNLVNRGDHVAVLTQLYATEVLGQLYIRCSLDTVFKRADGEQTVSSRNLREKDFEGADDFESSLDVSEGDAPTGVKDGITSSDVFDELSD